jgi:ABC-type lipoprotein export system ATPase subunit
MSPGTPIIELREVICSATGASPQRCSLRFFAGSFNLLVGAPGSGRSGLLRVLGLLDAPGAGEVLFKERATAALSEADREALRNRHYGFLFAAPFLLPKFSVVENVAMPLFRISHVSPDQARRRTDELLEFVGLGALPQEPIAGLTLGQQHAVSLARALGNEPDVLIVESLALNLPPEEAATLSGFLRQACESFGATVIASAPLDFALEKTDRAIELDAGAVRRDSLLEETPLA